MEATYQPLPELSLSSLNVELLDVVSILKSKLDILALYCFGLRQKNDFQKSFINPCQEKALQTFHLDLMVVSTGLPSNAIADLSDLIYKHTQGRYKVTLLVHTPSQLRSATYKNGFLFHNIISKGQLLQAHPDLPEPSALVSSHHLCVVQVKKFTANRLYNAQKLFNLEDAVTGVEGGLLRASLLHTGVEQLCLAIIYAYMGYYPNHFHLKYLFSLCSHCTPIINELFPDETQEDKKLLAILHTTPQQLRFKKPEQFTHTQLETLVGRCHKLYSKTEKSIQKHIDFLHQNQTN